MAYSTAASVREAANPGMEDPANPPAVASNTAADLPNAQLLDSIAEADALIDSYLGGRYTVPVDITVTVPQPIGFWSRGIALYLATLVFRKGQDFTEADPIARRYAVTMAALTAIRDGKSTLQIPTPAPGVEQGGIVSDFTDSGVASGWVQMPTITSW